MKSDSWELKSGGNSSKVRRRSSATGRSGRSDIDQSCSG